MAIFGEQLRDNIIKPTLVKMNAWSLSAEQLLLGTCAVETGLGSYIVQTKGPALGIYQMEPDTADDIYNNYLLYRSMIMTSMLSACDLITRPPNEALIYNLAYATAMCRIRYMRVSEPLPAPNNFTAMALYWKKYYNTPLGSGTVEKFNVAYQKFVAPLY